MKQILTFLLLGLATLSLTDCKKSDVDSPNPAETACKLTAIDRGNGNKHQYEYNAAGYVSKMTITFQGPTGTGSRQVYVYTFAYNARNQLTGAAITVDGKIPAQLTDWGIGSGIACQWTGEQLTEVKDLVGPKTILTTTLHYDAQGRITRFEGVPTDRNEPRFQKTLSYDADDNTTLEYIEEGKKYYSEKHIYDKTTQSAEALLARRGLPVDFFNLHPWKTNVLESFVTDDFDESGNVLKHRSFQITDVVKNRRNIAISQTVEEGSTRRVNTFTLSDCE